MIALLPNSGRGTRMVDATREHPKCMTPLDDRDTIISWQVRLLEEAGVRDAVVTTGPFAQLLEEASGLQVVLWDERRSSIQAHAILHAVGKKEKKHRATVDAVAASLLLESYLDSRRVP